jgi:hypothetical protein
VDHRVFQRSDFVESFTWQTLLNRKERKV